MITEQEQTNIIETIDSLCEGLGEKERETRRQLLFTGVLVGLGVDKLPPYWVANIQAWRTDRIVNKS